MELRHQYDLELLLNHTNMARSSFYYHQKQSKSLDKYQLEKELIKLPIFSMLNLNGKVEHWVLQVQPCYTRKFGQVLSSMDFTWIMEQFNWQKN